MFGKSNIAIFLFSLIPLFCTTGCQKENGELPRLSTDSAHTISRTSACFNGTIIDEGSDSIVDKGFCWSLQPYPTLGGQSKPHFPYKDGHLGNCISGLTPGTMYYARAYATNGAGTAYGNQVSFTTRTADILVQFNPELSYGEVLDIDGNSYNTITIGSQEWMAENLKTTRYNDGDPIPLITLDPSKTGPLPAGYCWYQNNEEIFKDMYGAYYNWFAVHTDKVCPSGWHVPTDEEWKILEMFLGMTSEQADSTGYRGTNEGEKIKETGTFNWVEESLPGSNLSGFTALPGGVASAEGRPNFAGEGIWAFWWSATEYYPEFAWNRGVAWNTPWITRQSFYKSEFINVRCVKD